MASKEVRIDSAWYDSSALFLDFLEWIGVVSSLFARLFIAIPIILFLIGIIIIAFGTALLFWSKKCVSDGRHQVEYQFGGGHEEVNKIVTDGPYRYTRHPWYLANTIQAVGVSIIWYVVSPWALLLGPAVLCVGIMRGKAEERWLAKEFPEYLKYKNRTKFPFHFKYLKVI